MEYTRIREFCILVLQVVLAYEHPIPVRHRFRVFFCNRASGCIQVVMVKAPDFNDKEAMA